MPNSHHPHFKFLPRTCFPPFKLPSRCIPPFKFLPSRCIPPFKLLPSGCIPPFKFLPSGCILLFNFNLIFKSKSGLADTTGPPQSVDYEILPIPVLRRLLLANNKLTTLSGQVCIQHVSFRSFQVLGTRPLDRWADNAWTVEPKIKQSSQFRNPKPEFPTPNVLGNRSRRRSTTRSKAGGLRVESEPPHYRPRARRAVSRHPTMPQARL